MRVASKKRWAWIAGAVLLITLLVVGNTRGPNSVVTFVLPDDFRGLITVPIKNSHKFWESRAITCVVSEDGMATEILGPTFSMRRARNTSGRDIPIVFGRPQTNEYVLSSSDVMPGEYFYLIAGDLSDYEAAWDELKRREMKKNETP